MPKRRVGFHLCFRGNIAELDSLLLYILSSLVTSLASFRFILSSLPCCLGFDFVLLEIVKLVYRCDLDYVKIYFLNACEDFVVCFIVYNP
jgi:uncharacterized membrane protein